MPSHGTATEDEEDIIKDVIRGFGKNLHEELERDRTLLEGYAERLTDLERVNLEDFEDGVGNTNTQLRRTRKIVYVLNADLDVGIPGAYVTTVDTVSDNVDTINKYLPVVAAGQNCIDCAQKYQDTTQTGTEEEIEDAKRELLIASLLLACEVCLLQSSTTYRLSFAGTRYATNHGLFHIRKYAGNRAYALVLSEVHWAIRGTLTGIQTEIIDQSQSLARDL